MVAGEESGDLLGADLVGALKAASGRDVALSGVGGGHLQALGLTSLFDPGEIALMGATAILKDLPRLISRIGETARTLVEDRPDCLVTIDSPDFSLRVAKKVRTADPSIPIIHYVCPSVWAWRPQRAPRMRAYVDHILCILPFEPAELQRLGGPPGTFVGHRLTHDAGIARAAEAQAARGKGQEKTLVILPGSRRSEVRGLIAPFGETVSLLRRRGNALRLVLPTVPQVAQIVAESTAQWEQKPTIITDPADKWRAFGQADAALAASGTVSLELALSRVPFVACYKADLLMRLAMGMITVWSGSLPNLIADRPVVPEFYDRFIRPAYLARLLETLMADTPARSAQLEGFSFVAMKMKTARPAGELAAEVVLNAMRPPS
jgi:lipid-A-disaccharide synthase